MTWNCHLFTQIVKRRFWRQIGEESDRDETDSVCGILGGECGQRALVFRIFGASDDAAGVAPRISFSVFISSLTNLAVEVLPKGLFADGGADGCDGGPAEAVGFWVHVDGNCAYSLDEASEGGGEKTLA